VVAGGAYRVVLLPVAWQSGSMVAAAIHILVPTDVEKIRKDVASMCDMPNLPVICQTCPSMQCLLALATHDSHNLLFATKNTIIAPKFSPFLRPI
jgi:hypothetical protein